MLLIFNLSPVCIILCNELLFLLSKLKLSLLVVCVVSTMDIQRYRRRQLDGGELCNKQQSGC